MATHHLRIKRVALSFAESSVPVYFNAATYIYPMVPAYAASNLQHHGYKVFLMDGIAEKKKYDEWIEELKNKVDYLMVETKSPIVKTHWKQINDIKEKFQHQAYLGRDHVSYLPNELFENSNIDYAIAGGDYDFMSVNLLNHIYKGEKLEGGVYWRKGTRTLRQDLQERSNYQERDLCITVALLP